MILTFIGNKKYFDDWCTIVCTYPSRTENTKPHILLTFYISAIKVIDLV